MENPFKSAGFNKDKKEDEKESITVIDDEEQEKSEETVEDTSQEQEAVTEEENKTSEIEEKYNQLNNQYIRLAADFDNYRKRTEQEREALLKYGAESTLKKMLEVIDNFERGLKAIESVDDCEKVKECYNLAYKNFNDALVKAGLETIQAEGQVFDPNFHEAVMQTPSEELEENTIVAELQKGYKLGDKVLRPSLVNVATKS